jgi:hypothetical protein
MTRFWWSIVLCLGFDAGPADAADPRAATGIATIAPQPMASQSPGKPANADASRQTWEEQQRAAYEMRQREAWQAYVNRPTAWQLQNPSGAQNRAPTDMMPRGYVTSNTYTGPQFRDWHNLSAPVMLPHQPADYLRPSPVTFTNVSLAPNTYWGPANQGWSNVRVGTAVPSGLGGWNYTPR